MEKRVVVSGAGGFIGHHLVKFLVKEGYWVRGVDIKKPEYEATSAHEFEVLDLRRYDNCLIATRGVEDVYHLAADMGGIGYITGNHADIARNDTMINMHMLEAARINDIQRFLYSSSACIYPQHLQQTPDVRQLKEDDAWPADPEEGYGLEKIYMEKLCQYYFEDYGMETRVVRFHNVYGPLGTYDGGKEKAPAAICRKVAVLQDGEEIEIWGDGEQTRSFMFIDDCIKGIYGIMESNYRNPLNLGTDELVTINQLVDMVTAVADINIKRRHDLSKPQGVRGRNSDNSLLRQVLGWAPEISLQEGLARTYPWIKSQMAEAGRIPAKRNVHVTEDAQKPVLAAR